MDFIKKPASHILLIVLLGVLTYSGTLHVPFVLDDVFSIAENPVIKDLGNFIYRADGYNTYPTRYIGYLTFALNYRFCGLNVECYHIVNLVIHLINAILVYLLVILTFKTDKLSGSPIAGQSGFIALFAAALFVAHPIETQAVTYTVQRLASLAALFFLASLVFFIKARAALGRDRAGRGSAAIFYILSLLSAALAMKTKETAFTLPLIALLYEFYFFYGPVKKRLLFLLPMLVTLFIIPVSMVGGHGQAMLSMTDVTNKFKLGASLPRWDYLMTQFSVIVTYIRLIFLPMDQQVDYDYPVSHSFFEPRAFGSFILLLCIIGASVLIFMRSRRGGDAAPRLVSFGILWFFITLSVESSIIPIEDVIFEHRVYLPSIGMFMTLACAGAIAAVRWPRAKPFLYLAAVVVALTLSVATFERNNVWTSEISLWQDNIRKSPGKQRPHGNLGTVYLAKGLVDRAIEEFRTAVTLTPGDAMAHNNLGAAYNAKGWTDEAIKESQLALQLKPDYAEPHLNLGLAYDSKGWVDKAIEEYRIGLILKPDNERIHNNLGRDYYTKGWVDKAIEEYLASLKLDPDDAKAHNNLGVAYHGKRLLDNAIGEYQTALRLNPDYADAHFNLGLAYRAKGRVDKARDEFQAVLKLQPDNEDARNNLKAIF